MKIATEGSDSEAIRAAEVLTSRVPGKPRETVEHVETPHDIARIAEMTPEERAATYAAITAKLDARLTQQH